MRQIGTGTMDTKDFSGTLQDSSASALVATGQTANSDNVTGGFGMKPVAPPGTGRLCLFLRTRDHIKKFSIILVLFYFCILKIILKYFKSQTGIPYFLQIWYLLQRPILQKVPK